MSAPQSPTKGGSLTIVGTGIRLIGQLTLDAVGHIETADRVLHLVTDGLLAQWLAEHNPHCESLLDCYAEGEQRQEAYERMVERILEPVRQGEAVCVAFYGHPGVFVTPSHEAIRRAREEGYPAEMLPGISAEDCLFADLGVDPGPRGCQSFEATDFLLRQRRFDPTSVLILWQIGCIGDPTFRRAGYDLAPLTVLTRVLLASYPGDHVATVYRSAVYPIVESRRTEVPLEALPEAPVDAMCTLYVPPLKDRPSDPEMRRLLGLVAQ